MDRRNWFRYASIAGGALALNPLNKFLLDSPEYHPLDTGENDLARLCYNENPFGPSKLMRNAIIDSFVETHKYPFQFINDFADVLAKKHGVSRAHIVITAGSREGLNMAGVCFAEEGGNIVAATPTYKALLTYATGFGMHIYNVPLDKDLKHDLDAMEKRITNRTNLVFVCNPNNPTGTLLSAQKMQSFCERLSSRTIVFADEVYQDYLEESNYPSMIDLVKQDLNVIVARTFSKVYGLAGIRIGYLITRPDIAARLREKQQAGTNIPAVAAAKAALEDTDFYTYSLNKNREAKEYVYDLCNSMGLQFIRSHTNFVFFKSGMEINTLNMKMKDKGVLVGRPFPPLTDWCRISTGKMEDMERFGKALQEVLV